MSAACPVTSCPVLLQPDRRLGLSIGALGDGVALFQIQAVTEGTDAQAEVTVRLEEAARRVVGQAADTDRLVASAQAYIAAFNRLLTKREKTCPAALSA